MVYGAIDLHMRYSQIRIVDADGTVRRDQRVVTTARALAARRSPRPGPHPDSARDGDRE